MPKTGKRTSRTARQAQDADLEAGGDGTTEEEQEDSEEIQGDEAPEEPVSEGPPEEDVTENKTEDITEDPKQETPVSDPVQFPDSYTTYYYALDALNTATLYDMYKTMQEKGVYTFVDWNSPDGYSLYMDFATAEWDQRLTVWYEMPKKMQEIGGVFSTEEMLSLCSGCIIGSISGSYNSVGMDISPVFRDGMTYSEIIQICESNGYSHEAQENELYHETYLNIGLGGGISLSFKWDVYGIDEIADISPVSFSIG